MRSRHRGGRHRASARIAWAAALVLLAIGKADAQNGIPGNFTSGVSVSPIYSGIGYGNTGFGSAIGGYGFGGYGAGGGYGFGGYGGGYGYGGGGYGYGGYGGGYGVSPFQLQAFRQQRYALNASRYNLQNAETASSYQLANLFRTEAMQNMAETYRNSKYGGSGGNGQGQYSVSDPQPKDPFENLPPVPINDIFAKDGTVLWPLGAPEEGDLAEKKATAGRSIQSVARDALAKQPVTLSRVVAARDDLAAYANPAASWFKDHSAKDIPGFVNFIRSMDDALRGLAESKKMGTPPAKDVGPMNFNPPTAPKTGGDILLQEMRDKKE